ncbi:MAG: Permease of the drug/metabolite transporter (DMT) superfamily [Brockia lithotrophica]|uniref:Permease of the drug/metabolite transporter (DMT) superfamily n=1 Tax=Brockia lithotrophica TaxID=933949 RepID=A0A2T5G7E4_9BACL|nr:DMT family transporter [Brockia lithotrophica]PTQ52113.1 MAG: Permease of the drug/metabolite transporter (DMT) superfamily [Brockia lithotrophica]
MSEFLLVGVSFVWGTTFVLVKDALPILPPFAFLAVRFALAFLFFLPLCLWERRRGRAPVRPADVALGFRLGMWLFLGYALQTVGLQHTTAAKAGFLTGLSVILVPLLGWLLGRNDLRKRDLLSAAAALLGLYFLTGTEAAASAGAAHESLGDLLVLLCALFFAVQIVETDRLVRQSSPTVLATFQVLAVAVFSIPFSLLWEADALATLGPRLLAPPVLLALAVTSFFATTFAFWAQAHAQRRVPPSHVALIFALEPVFAALAGVLWAGEPFTLSMGIGSALILGGILLTSLLPRSPQSEGENGRNAEEIPTSE